MRTKISLTSLILFFSLLSFSQTIITNSGNTFSPASVTISYGESVQFNIATAHNVIEVSQSTWNSNGNAALSGGFQLGFGGGALTSNDLTVGTHYYVCFPHASSGMKGMIIVENNTTGIEDTPLKANFTISPNPSYGKFQLIIDESFLIENSKFTIYNIHGKEVFQSVITNKKTEIDLRDQIKGIYFLRTKIGQKVILKKILIH